MARGHAGGGHAAKGAAIVGQGASVCNGAASGCATRSSTTGSYVPTNAALPKPRRVLVMDFADDPARVSLDQGIGPRLERQLSPGAPGGSRYDAAAQVQSAISETLVSEIRKMGLFAERAGPGTVPQPGDALVQGQIERVSEGNRTRASGGRLRRGQE